MRLSFSNLPTRIRNYVAWRSWQLGRWAGSQSDRLARRSGWLSRRSRWPLPRWSPCRLPELHVARERGMGDILMCTAALRRLKEVNPRCRLTFYTGSAKPLLDGLPFIDELRHWNEAPATVIWLRYEESLPPRRHLAQILGDHIGVDVRDVRPSCVIDPHLKEMFQQKYEGLPRPWIIINRYASDWTPNKDWPDGHWEILIERLVRWATIFEIGTVPPRAGVIDSDRYVSLVGELSLEQLVAALAASDLNVGPISGPVHIAAAVGVPSVVIFGGYEHPICTHYPGNIDLYSDLPCSPCWLRSPCPYDKKCLSRIGPDVVERSLERLWEGKDRRNKRRRLATNLPM